MLEEIKTASAPAAIGPYSQAVRTGGMIFVSGQLPIDPATGIFAGEDIESQTRQSIENIQSVLAEAGLTLDHVVKTTVYLRDMNDFAAMNDVYSRFFTGICPARVAVEVSALPKGAAVEIDAIAAV
ncbi:MAG: RidA family protein [Lachnospiraceae bacterium]|nr:RidA family protein [Lachnospiraceae bacterium]